MKINREDMLELTRRMTLKRNCFSRIAGAYVDENGELIDSFNVSFKGLTDAEKQKHLGMAKAVPFARTNEELIDHRYDRAHRASGGIRRLMLAMKQCALKNDALMYTFYEYVAARYRSTDPYGIYVFHGAYDVPLKGMDKQSQWESEEVYEFLICVVCAIDGDYEPALPQSGFLFPTFTDRSSDAGGIAVYQREGCLHPEWVDEIVFS